MQLNSPIFPGRGLTSTRDRDIQLAIIESGSLRVFHLSACDERVITVGATTSADIQFDLPDISPIHFYFERLDDDVWIVPAYCVSGLQVNSTKVTMPQKLGTRAKVEFGRITLDLEVTHPVTELALCRGQSVPLANDFDAGEDNEPTHQAWADPTKRMPLERSVVTLMVPRRALAQSSPKLPESETVRISRIRSVPADSKTGFISNTTQSTPTIKPVEVPSLKRTLYGVSPSIFGTDNPHLAPPKVRRHRTQSLAPLSLARTQSRKPSMLYQLGQLTRQRPLAAFTTAFMCALLGAVLVVFATSTIMRAHGTATTSAPWERSR